MGWVRFGGGLLLWCAVPRVRCPGPPGSCSPACMPCVWCCVCGVLGRWAPVHRCARSVCGGACTVSWASWLLFTGVHAVRVVLCVRCPGLPGSCSPVCTLCVCGVSCTASWASWLLFTGVHALCVVLRVRRSGPPGSCSPVCTLCVWCCVYGVLGLLAPVHRCARSVFGVACTASWASWLLFTGVHALSVVLRVRCPGPPGSCSPMCTLCVWCCVYCVLGLLAPVHRCARSVCGVVCTVPRASWLLFTGAHALCVVLLVRRSGPPGSCSPVCTLCVWCCVYGVLALLAPVHRCARSVCGVACTVSWASWLLFTGVHALCVVLRVRCPGPPGSCLPVCTLCVWCCVYGVLGLLAPVHRCARSVCGVACTASWTSWLLFTGVHALCVVLRVRCSGPPGSCSPVCTLCVWCCVYGLLGLLAPVHRCARSVCGVGCAVSCAAWLLFTCVPAPVCCVVCTASWVPWLRFTGVHALCAVLCVRRPRPLGSSSPVRVLVVLCRLCCVLGFLAPVLPRARTVCGVVCVVSWAFWPFLCWCARVVCVVLCVWCPGTLGSCSPVSRCVAVCVVSGVRCCGCGVLGLPAPVHRCARPVCGVVWAVSWAAWLLFIGVLVRCVVWCVRCPGPLGSCSPVCLCGVCCVACSVSWAPWLPFTGVLCACSVCCVLCAVSSATWLLFTAVRARCVAWCVRCGCGCVLACRIPLQRRCGLFVFVYTWIDTVGNATANSPLASRPPRRPASYGVLLILPALDSLILATPKSKRVLMHAWWCMLFTRWFVDSLHFATPKSRRVCLMHSSHATYSLCDG